jgi:predicted nucleic acid-binding Zn ribbon protein
VHTPLNRSALRAQGRVRSCAACGRPLWQANAKKKFCSDRCRQAAHRSQKWDGEFGLIQKDRASVIATAAIRIFADFVTAWFRGGTFKGCTPLSPNIYATKSPTSSAKSPQTLVSATNKPRATALNTPELNRPEQEVSEMVTRADVPAYAGKYLKAADLAGPTIATIKVAALEELKGFDGKVDQKVVLYVRSAPCPALPRHNGSAARQAVARDQAGQSPRRAAHQADRCNYLQTR